MSSFHASRWQYFGVPLVGSLALVAWGIAGLATRDPNKMGVGLIVFGVGVLNLVNLEWYVRRAAVVIDGQEIKLMDHFGRRSSIKGISECELTSAKASIRIRDAEGRVFALSRATFSRSTWTALVKAMGQLPFQAVE
jgi:hypothetical protein